VGNPAKPLKEKGANSLARDVLIPASMLRLSPLICFVALLACEGQIVSPSPKVPVTQTPTTPAPPGKEQCVPGTTSEPMPLRRLTRLEYDNTVRDLLGSTKVRGDKLPTDEKTGLFLSNVSGSVSWNMLEQYGTSAEDLVTDIARVKAAVAPCNAATVGESVCANRFIDEFGLKAFRRPLSIEERDRYRALYTAHKDRSGHDTGLRFVVRTMLQSPNFIYHAGEGLAPRLAFALWNSTPDAELLAAEQNGSLTLAEGVSAQVDRLLADDRSRSAMGTFHLQLLGVDATTTPNKSPTRYPDFGASKWLAMVGDTARFADHVIRKGDGKLSTLLTASFGVNEAGEEVPLDPTQRAGILTQPAVLAGLANPDTTSPIRRGVMIRRNLMCQNLPDPPPEAPTVLPPAQGQETTRQRVTRVTSQSSVCASCHGFINDVGFSFEHYGPAGEWQTQDNGLPIDASGKLTGTAASDGTFDGAPQLASRLAGAKEVQSCYSTQWVRFALGRKEQPADNCELQELSAAFSTSGGDIKNLVRGVLLSRAFASGGHVLQPDPGPGGAGGGGGGSGAGGGSGGSGGSGGAGGSGGTGGAGGGTAAPTTTLLMAVNAQLLPNQSLTTSDGTHKLIYQLDGNLVLYRLSDGVAVWNSVTAGTTPGLTVMQGDGNFVVYDASNVAKFNTGTQNNPGAQLFFETGGRIHVISTGGTKLFTGGTP
jgi:hypothetical protein